MPDPLRALVYRPGSLGDTLVSLPAIAEIRRAIPLASPDAADGTPRRGLAPRLALDNSQRDRLVRRRAFLCRAAGHGARSVGQYRVGHAPAPRPFRRYLFARAAANLAAIAASMPGFFAASSARGGTTPPNRRHGRRPRCRRGARTKGCGCFASLRPVPSNKRSIRTGCRCRMRSERSRISFSMRSACGLSKCWLGSRRVRLDRARRGRPSGLRLSAARCCGSSAMYCCWRSAVRRNTRCARSSARSGDRARTTWPGS